MLVTKRFKCDFLIYQTMNKLYRLQILCMVFFFTILSYLSSFAQGDITIYNGCFNGFVIPSAPSSEPTFNGKPYWNKDNLTLTLGGKTTSGGSITIYWSLPTDQGYPFPDGQPHWVIATGGGNPAILWHPTSTANLPPLTGWVQYDTWLQQDPDLACSNASSTVLSIAGANPTVNLSVSTNTSTEAAATVITVTATASAAVSGNQTLALGVSGTGITAGDYTLSNATITIPDAQTTGSVTFAVVDDALIEGTEIATLTISSPSSGISLGTTTQNVSITDNDLPTSVCVTTDCSSYNGNYTKGADFNTRPSYTNGTVHIFHSGTSWYLGKGGLGATQTADIVFEIPSMANVPPTTGWGANEDNDCVDATFELALSACPCVTPTVFSVTGGGSLCAGATGVSIGLSGSETGVTYQLKREGSNVGSAVSGTGSALAFGTFTIAGTYTVEATRVTGGCSVTMTGSAIVTVISLPTAYNVTGGGPFCAGGSGSLVGLASSQTGVNYQLKKAGNNVGSAVGGTGSAISFGNQTDAGTYTVVATTATGSCTATMTGNAEVSVVTLPSTFTVTGGGSFCSGGTGVVVGLSGSETGVSYQLKKGGSNVGSAVGGTGSAISFGFQTGAGTYTVEASKVGGSPVPVRIGVGAAAPPTTTTCTQAMTGSVDVTVISLPTAYNVTGGGPFCPGEAGVPIGLSGSQTGVNYQLKKDGSNVGSTVSGTGSAISFGLQTTAGVYTVGAITVTGGCEALMLSNQMVIVKSAPTVFNVTGGGNFCQGGAGVVVGLSGSESGVTYQLKKDNDALGSAITGTGSAISFGNQANTGTYTVMATKTVTACTTSMTSSAVVSYYTLPAATISGTSTTCKGGASATITFTGSNGVAPYTFSYQLNGGAVQTVTTTGGSSSATVSQNASVEGVYTYTLTSVSDANCSQSQSGKAVVTVQTKPLITLSTQQVTLNEGNTQEFCDIDANPVNSLQFNVSISCVVGSPVWRVQVGSGAWSSWSSTSPVSQLSNNQVHRYQAACDANCPSSYTSPIEVKINYRASVPQAVSLVADGVMVNAGETKDICNIAGNGIVFNTSCASTEVVLYSVDGGDYSNVVPIQLVDGQYHNYRVRCRKSDGTVSCVETESGVMRIRLTSMWLVPVASLNVTSGCGVATIFSGTTNCGSMTTIWYNAATDVALSGLPSQTPSVTSSYYARCQAESGCMSEKSNVVTYTVTAVSEVPVVNVSSDIVCTGVEVTVSTSCPGGSSALWNTGVTDNSFKVSFANVTKQSYSVRCIYTNGCQSSASAIKEVMWKAFELTIINIGESKSGIKTNSRSAWAGQFVTPDAGPALDQSTQGNPTVYYSENLNKTSPRYWTIHVDACTLGESGSLTYDLLATPETGLVRSYNTHENNAPYFMFANRSGYTELYAQNHPLYGFYADNGSGGNVYDEGFPKGLYKLGIRYWDMKGWGSIYPSTRKPQGNVLAYQEYWFRIQSKDGIGLGAARTAESGQQLAVSEEAKSKNQGASDDSEKGAFAWVVPNPVTNVLRLKVQDSKGQVVQTQLVDASGRVLLGRSFVPESNQHQEEFGVQELPTGMYFLKVVTEERQATLKVVKVN